MSSSQIQSKKRRFQSETTSINPHLIDEYDAGGGDEEMDVEQELLDVETADFGQKKPTKGRCYVKRKGRKRKAYWEHFWDYLDDNGMARVECKYCDATFAADTNRCGTTNLKRHAENCKENPKNKGKGKGKQSHLSFDVVVSEDMQEETSLKYRNSNVDLDEVREALSEMIITEELPFSFVERPGFKKLFSIACPLFHMPSRTTITRDCYKLYVSERLKLKELLGASCQRVSVTTDTWTSIQRINYMCLTAHFIDDEWRLQKRVLNFCPITSHKGEAIGRAIEDCLDFWGLKGKLFTVTVDNASSNDTACAYLKSMVRKEGGIGDGKNLHMRCIAHIINLIVWDGLKELGNCIDRIRAIIKYIRSSPARLIVFKQHVERCKIECKACLSLDVPTRWNSTYVMLSTAVKFRDAFNRMELPCVLMEECDDVDDGPLSDDEWDKIKHLVVFLKEFYDVTNNVFGSLYVTSNNMFFEIVHVYESLNQWILDVNEDFQSMARQMKAKFDKYWGDIDKTNMMIYLGVILDPNLKLLGVKMTLCNIYGDEKGERMAGKIKNFVYDLLEEYKRLYGTREDEGSELQGDSNVVAPVVKKSSKARMEEQVMRLSGAYSSITELDRYLEEKKGRHEENDVLIWWKVHGPRYPILSHMARDVLAVPISTVASESTFSACGRHLDQFRSSLTPKMVQALICTQDWIRGKSRREKIEVEERLEDLEEVEKDVEKKGHLEGDDVVYVA